MKLQLGFSDELDHSSQTGYMLHQNKKDTESSSWEYNLYKPSSAKQTVTWTMMDKPCVSSLRQSIQDIQQGPHLNFVRTDKLPFALVPSYFNYLFRVDVNGLLDPIVELDELQPEDYADLMYGREYGDLYITLADLDKNMNRNDQKTSLRMAYDDEDSVPIANARPRDAHYVTPFMSVQCNFMTNPDPRRYVHETDWLSFNQETLESNGFDIKGPNSWLETHIKVGKLDIAKVEFNDLINKYNYIVSMEWIDD